MWRVVLTQALAALDRSEMRRRDLQVDRRADWWSICELNRQLEAHEGRARADDRAQPPPLPAAVEVADALDTPAPPTVDEAEGEPVALRMRGSGGQHTARVPISTTVPYARASIYSGLPSEELAARLDSLLDNRLSASAMRSVSAAMRLWDRARAPHGWERIIRSDDPSRGGKLATLVLFMLDDTELSAATITTYVWGVRVWTKLQRQLDPIYGLAEWDDLMATVAVVAYVVAEPRKALPFRVLERAVVRADASKFGEVQMVVLMLLLFFSFARSETPLSKTYEGAGAFDAAKQLQVKDVRVVPASGEVPAHVQMRIKGTKQDPRMERASAVGNEDWVALGDTPSSPMGVLVWLQRLFALHGGVRDPDEPFFVHDRSVPLTMELSAPLPAARSPLLYWQGMALLRHLLSRVVTPDEAKTYGFHSLRVIGYDLARRGVGPELAQVHGGWSSNAHQRYQRFSRTEAVALAEVLVREGSSAHAEITTFVLPEARVNAPAVGNPTAPGAPALERALPAGRGPDARTWRRGAGGEEADAEALDSDDAALDPPPPQPPPQPGTRIAVYWTGERAWYEGTCTSNRTTTTEGGDEARLTRVMYDRVGAWANAAKKDLAYWHSLADELWKPAPVLPAEVQEAAVVDTPTRRTSARSRGS